MPTLILSFVWKHLLVVALSLVVLILLGMHFLDKRSADKEKVDLQNQLALRDKTIEEKNGLYEHLAISSSGVIGQLDESNAQVKALKEQLKKSGEQLDNATSVALNWKKAYEGVANATQSTVPSTDTSPSAASRIRVDFNENWGYISAKGYTLTSPPEAFVHVQQDRPLKLTVALSQDKTGAWHSYTTSSEDNVNADITVSAVNPSLRNERWYERIGVAADLGIGSQSTGAALLLGVGATLQIGQFDVGPSIWMTVSDHADKFYGASMVWHPWGR